MHEDLQIALEDYMEKAINTRFDFVNPEFGSGPVVLHSSLVSIQDSLTDIERYLSRATKIKAAAERRVAKFKMQWQAAWDKAISVVNKKPSFGEYTTGKEKASEANLATFEETRQLRAEEDLLSFANEAVEIIRLHYYGLDKLRQDIRKRLDMSQTDYYS